MRIGIDIRALMEGKTTGVQVYITNLLRTLFEIDKQNEYVLFGSGFKNVEFRMLNVERGNVRYKIFHYPNKLFMPAQKYLSWPKIDKLLGGIDLFFSPHWRLMALEAQTPLVITFHDLSFEISPQFFTLKQRLWHKFMDYAEAARKATKIIAVSKSTRQDLIDLYVVAESKIKIIYPGVAPLPQPLPQGEGRGYFLYFGTFEPRKNVEAALKAYEIYYRQSLIKRPLVLAGSKGWKTKLLVPPVLREKITVRYNVNEEKKRELFSNAFVFLFLSYYEGFGFPVLEAASAGVPVISSFASSLSEIAGDFALLVNPFRASQTAQAMLALERDLRLYQELKTKGLAVAKRFSWERTARQTLELFNEITNDS